MLQHTAKTRTWLNMSPNSFSSCSSIAAFFAESLSTTIGVHSLLCSRLLWASIICKKQKLQGFHFKGCAILEIIITIYFSNIGNLSTSVTMQMLHRADASFAAVTQHFPHPPRAA
eukprot:1158384-Pelagomonas_calceolata.AAC.3